MSLRQLPDRSWKCLLDGRGMNDWTALVTTHLRGS